MNVWNVTQSFLMTLKHMFALTNAPNVQLAVILFETTMVGIYKNTPREK